MKRKFKVPKVLLLTLPLIGLSFYTISYSWNSENPAFGIDEKQRGAHVFGITDSTDFQLLHDTNIQWITQVSWGFQDDYNSARVSHHNGDSIYMKKHNEKWIQRIKSLKDAGFKVFFKPHLWIDKPTDNTWRADIYPKSDSDWQLWQESYRDFIIRYAKIAESSEADMFCIGTEFTRLTLEKPEFWVELIKEVRRIYSGKITYAANWYQEYEEITFWDQLDYIGVQAYFPLTKKDNPKVSELKAGWNSYLPSLEAVHIKYDLPILFTELGYRSIASGAAKPWEWIEASPYTHLNYSPATQANSYQAFFDTVWNKNWFSGVHLWQMRMDYIPQLGDKDIDFTPLGKPAEFVIAREFK